MAGFMRALEDHAVLSADLGVSTRKRKLTNWTCLECKGKVRVDAVQGWSVGCPRSDVMSYQIESTEPRLKLVAVKKKKGDDTSVQKALVVHAACIPFVALAACKELLTLHAPEQADRLSAAVPVEAISSAVDSDDESMGTDSESRVSWKCPTECSISLPRGAQPDNRTVAPSDC